MRRTSCDTNEPEIGRGAARGETMRLALISDIHGNINGLKAILTQV